MIEMYSFFRIILTKYLVRDPLCPELLEVAGSIFSWEKALHNNVLPKYFSEELQYFEHQNAQNTRRVDRE